MPGRPEVILALRHMATLLELDGANSFKTNAYLKAAQILSDEDINLGEYVEKNRLTEIPGIGKGIAEKINEFWINGEIAELDELKQKYPDGLVDMTAIPGFGAKKARIVFDSLGVKSVDELVEACNDGRVAKLKGFGEKTAQKICSGVEQMRRHSGRFRFQVADKKAQSVLRKLKEHAAVQQVEIAGSLRRWRETVKDIDFVCATDKPEEVMEFFATLPDVFSVIGKGKTKTSVLLDSNLQADLRCVSQAEYPFALQHFTGSREHNTALRARAKRMELKSNEYGLFKEGSDKSLAAESEADVYEHLGLKYIEPELRENMGEIEAAAEDKLPCLVTAEDLRGIFHMHTKYSDGNCNVEDYAQWAVDNAIEWMGICDHSQTAAYAGGLKPADVKRQWKEIESVNERFAGKNGRILKGIESDILKDGSLDYDEDILAGFDVVVASIHNRYNLKGDEQTRRMIRAIENPYTTAIGHMSGRLLLKRDPIPLDQGEIIRQCAKHGVIVEINADPHRLDVDWTLIKYALEQGCVMSIGPDAHSIANLEFMRYGMGMARKGWVTREKLVNCWSVDEFLAYAHKRRK